MSDDRLRELERRALTEGTLEARTAFLRERVRSGHLGEAWLEMAARLGDPAARAVLGRFVPVATLDMLHGHIRDFDREACARFALVAAKLEPRRLGSVQLERGIEAVERWLATPDDASRAGCAAVADGHGDQRLGATGVALACVTARTDEDARDAVRSLPLWGPAHAGIDAGLFREALRPWALDPAREPGARLRQEGAATADALDEPDPAAAVLREQAFRAELETKETAKEATALKKRLKDGILEKDRVFLAALLGDAAAWLVVKPEEGTNPQLAGPRTGVGMARLLSRIIAEFAKPLPKDEQRRIAFLRRIREADGEGEAGPLYALPDWSRPLVARIALAAGERAHVVLAAGDAAEGANGRAALDAARAYFMRSGAVKPAEVGELAKPLSRRRRGPEPVRAAAQVVGWACELVVRTLDKAQRAKLDYANRDLLGRLVDAGVPSDDVWDLIRATAIAWALREDVVSSTVRAYSAKERFGEGELLAHPKFGEGRVVGVEGAKIRVQFAEGVKVLAHAPA